MKKFLILFPWWILYGGNNIDIIAERIRAVGESNLNVAKADVQRQFVKKAQIENDAFRIRELRKLKEEKKKITALDKQEKRLNNVERAFALKQREEKLRASGALSAKKEPKIVIMGQEFASYTDFLNSDTYLKFKAEVAKRIEEDKKEDLQKEIGLQKLIWETHLRSPEGVRKTVRKECEEIRHKVQEDPWNKVIIERKEMTLEEVQEWRKRNESN